MIEQELSDEEQVAALELEARLEFPNLPIWKAIFELAMREGSESLARIERADAACRGKLPPTRRAFRDAT